MSRNRSHDNKFSSGANPKGKAILLLVLIFISTIITLPMLQPTNVEAATTSASQRSSNDWQIKSLLYYKSITYCMDSGLVDNAAGLFSGFNNRISPTNAASGKWFASGIPTSIGVYMNADLKVGQDGLIDCSSPLLISNALSLWGLKAIDVLCNSGFQRADISNPNLANCLTGTTNFERSGDAKNSTTMFAQYIRQQIYSDPTAAKLGPVQLIVPEPKLTSPQLYIFYRHSLNQSCIPNIDSTAPTTDANYTNGYNNVQWVGNTPPELVTGSYPPGGGLTPTDRVTIRPWVNAENGDASVAPRNGDYKGTWETCSNLVKLMNNNESAYLTWATIYPSEAAKDNLTGSFKGPTPTTSSCDIPGVGWIVCPVVRLMASLADSAFGFISDNFLNTSPSILNTDPAAMNADGTLVGTTTYQAWQIMRNIANVAFLITFLIMIFSQITSIGITNYGIKKLFPKLIFAAILVNLSFILCQIAVDLSNIIGYSLENLLAGLAPVSTSTGGTFSGNSWANYAGGALVLGATGAIAWASLAALIPALFAAIVALVMILFILIGRQAIIILLVVISPLAFVAFILPNTEKLFKTWQKTATSMLLLFPIVAAVFGVSKLASTILSSVFSANNNTIGGIASAAVMVLPLFIVPSLLKKSLDGIGNIGTGLNKLGTRLGSGAGKVLGTDRYNNSAIARGREIRKSAKAQYKTGEFARRVQAGGLTSLSAGGLTSLGAAGLSKLGTVPGLSRVHAPGSWQTQRGAVSGSARSAVANADAKDLSDEMTLLELQRSQAQVADEAAGKEWKNDDYLVAIANNTDGKRTQLESKAALHTLGRIGSADALRRLRGDPKVNQTDLLSAISANTSSLTAKAPDLIKGNAGAFKNITGAGLSAFAPGTAQAHMQYLSDLYDKSIAPGASKADTDAFEGAKSAFNSAVDDIVKNPTLQAAFNKDAGQKIRKITSTIARPATATTPAEEGVSAGFAAHIASGALAGISAVQSDGKIR